MQWSEQGQSDHLHYMIENSVNKTETAQRRLGDEGQGKAVYIHISTHLIMCGNVNANSRGSRRIRLKTRKATRWENKLFFFIPKNTKLLHFKQEVKQFKSVILSSGLVRRYLRNAETQDLLPDRYTENTTPYSLPILYSLYCTSYDKQPWLLLIQMNDFYLFI